MRRKTLSFAVLAVLGTVAARGEEPVGLVLEGGGSIERPGRETPFDAAPGVELFAGDVITTAAEPVRFAFCPGDAVRTLSAGRRYEVTSSANDPVPAFVETRPASVCEVPAMSRL